MGFLLLLFSILMGMVTIRRWQTGKIKMYYQPSNTLWNELLTATGLNNRQYKPSLFALNATWQLFWFGVISAAEKLFGKVKYQRQIFELADGGELALDWLTHQTSENKALRNIVICVPGLSGDSREVYCLCIAKQCIERNLDFVVINYRGTSGVPLKVRIFR